jgi:hypothetical protein
MPHSAVTGITFHDGDKINLSITIPNWPAGLPIEISGQAIQGNEAVATFYSVQPMTDTGVIEVADVAAVLPYHFEAGSPIMVVARATEAWVSTLQMNEGSQLGTDPTYSLSEAHWAVAWPGQKEPADWPSQNGQTP